jgi:outer membrane protein OmpA-like peptidoglycan-associated protein
VKFGSLILLLIGLSIQVNGQETTVINQFSDKGRSGDYQLKQSDQYTFIVNYYTPKQSPEEEIAELLGVGLDLYVDKSYKIGDENLILSNDPSKMLIEMSSLVNQGLQLFQIKNVFTGFSPKIYSKLKSLEAMSWTDKEYELLGDNPQERKEMLQYFIDSEILDLKGLCKTEIASFLKNEKTLEIPDVWAKKMNQSVDIESPIAYEAEGFIPPLEYILDEPVSATDFDQELSLPKSFIDDYNRQLKKQNKRNKRNKDDFNEELLALLQQNSSQLLAIQKDLADFQKENIVHDREIRKENNDQSALLQEQIDELKEMIYSDERTPKDLSIFEKSAANEKLLIYFDKNSFELSNQYKLELNRVLSVLIKNAELKIMITGYADKSGDADFNAYISQKRAEEVKKYLYKKGISSKRMVMNYLGDINSTSENAGDRRVEIEFINEIGMIDLSSN